MKYHEKINNVHTGPGCKRKPVSEWPDNGTSSFPSIGGFSITDRSELITIPYNKLCTAYYKFSTDEKQHTHELPSIHHSHKYM